jgi:hypothetical protein
MKLKMPVSPSQPPREPWPPLAVFMFKTAVGTLAGGILFSLLASLFHRGSLALGLFLGALLSVVYLMSLRRFSAKVLQAAGEKKNSTFWMHQALRWLLFALICWILARVSSLCLLGAVLSFTWFIAVLAWVGWMQGLAEKNKTSSVTEK